MGLACKQAPSSDPHRLPAGPKSPADVGQINVQERFGERTVPILRSCYSCSLAPLAFSERQLPGSPTQVRSLTRVFILKVGSLANKVAQQPG